MTTPVGPVQFGPGSLSIGAAGGEVDYSFLVNGATLTTTVDTADPVTKLSGQKYPGLMTLSGEFAANIDVDPGNVDGLFQLSSEHAGTIQAFRFVPNAAANLEARGNLQITPVPFGAAAFGDDLAGDVTWVTFGNIDFYRDDVLAWTQDMTQRTGVVPSTPATGATAGTPGTLTPPGCALPADVAAMSAVVASPTTAWATGEHVLIAGGGKAYWNGTAWTAGQAP